MNAATIVVTMLGGCCSHCGRVHVDKCADIPPGAIPQPAGTYACQWQQAHIEQGGVDRFVVYEHEWHRGGTELGPSGLKHAEELARELMAEPRPVVVESHYDSDRNRVDSELDEARRQAVVKALLEKGLDAADSYVVVGSSKAEGMYGTEAVQVGARRLLGGQRGGGGIGGGGGGGGGIGGGGGYGGGGFF